MNVFTDKSALQLQEVHVLENVIFFPLFGFFISDPRLIKNNNRIIVLLGTTNKNRRLKEGKSKMYLQAGFFSLFQN